MGIPGVRWLGLILIAAISSTCGGGSDEGGAGVMRFVFAPGPVWDYLRDSGIRQEMETACGLRIQGAPTWDEFGIYAGGHADVVSVGSFEVPVLEKESGRESVVFGKFNIDRSVIVVPSDSQARTLADVAGGKVAVWDTVSSTMIWGILVEKLHSLDFRPDGGDFELVLTDIPNAAELAANGEVDAALILPDFSVPQLLEKRIRVIYDGRSSADMYSELIGTPHQGPMINVFVARKDYFETHPGEIRCLLQIFERGLQEWQSKREELIASYPQHFAVESQDEIAFITNYLKEHDWFASTVYLDSEWVEGELQLFDLMRETGFMSPDQSNPDIRIVAPEAPGQ